MFLSPFTECEDGHFGVFCEGTCHCRSGIPGHGIFGLNHGSQHWGLCIPRESENVNVGPVSNWDVNEPLTTLSVNTDRST